MQQLAGSYVSEKRFFTGSFQVVLFFLLTQAEKRVFCQLKALISAEVRKKKEPLEKNQ